tara:strand:+ start:487 stop:726 length:240 start_codon:yes stop_codon:yes gene_type:complete
LVVSFIEQRFQGFICPDADEVFAHAVPVVAQASQPGLYDVEVATGSSDECVFVSFHDLVRYLISGIHSLSIGWLLHHST